MDLHGHQDQTPDVTVTRRVRRGREGGECGLEAERTTFCIVRVGATFHPRSTPPIHPFFPSPSSTTTGSRRSTWSAAATAMAIPSTATNWTRSGHSSGCANARFASPPFAHPTSPLPLAQHNTEGENCQRCRPGFEQKRWRQSHEDDPFVCEPCNCHGHSNQSVLLPIFIFLKDDGLEQRRKCHWEKAEGQH